MQGTPASAQVSDERLAYAAHRGSGQVNVAGDPDAVHPGTPSPLPRRLPRAVSVTENFKPNGDAAPPSVKPAICH
ncbi:hypothetical protein Asp14428_44490 [Actinoplanes sp. NBRC 14428]|nr:hypothetical protein Asp14428_44490 [Actinoplanes sp. NBRC 14428]